MMNTYQWFLRSSLVKAFSIIRSVAGPYSRKARCHGTFSVLHSASGKEEMKRNTREGGMSDGDYPRGRQRQTKRVRRKSFTMKVPTPICHSAGTSPARSSVQGFSTAAPGGMRIPQEQKLPASMKRPLLSAHWLKKPRKSLGSTASCSVESNVCKSHV